MNVLLADINVHNLKARDKIIKIFAMLFQCSTIIIIFLSLSISPLCCSNVNPLFNIRYFALFYFTARRFDFFDVGMMDVLQYRLEKAEKVMCGREIEVTFKGRIIGKRRAINGDDEFQVTWSPAKM